MFQTESGSAPLLAFGSYLGGIFQVSLTLPPVQLQGEVKGLAFNQSNDAMEAAYQFGWNVKGKRWYVRCFLSGHSRRSPALFVKPIHIGTSGDVQLTLDFCRYYLFFSSGRCCNPPDRLPARDDEYKVMVCRSSSPTGPFVDDHDKPCLESGGKMVLGSHGDVYGPGGQGVLYDQQLRSPIMYYHYMNKSTGYRIEDVYFGWNKLDFESGWPVLVGEKKGKGHKPPAPKPSDSGSRRAQPLTITAELYLADLVVIAIALMI